MLVQKRKTKTLRFYQKFLYNVYGLHVTQPRGTGFRWLSVSPKVEHLVLMHRARVLNVFQPRFIKIQEYHFNDPYDVIPLPKVLIDIVFIFLIAD